MLNPNAGKRKQLVSDSFWCDGRVSVLGRLLDVESHPLRNSVRSAMFREPANVNR